jgi:hypothetical protein
MKLGFNGWYGICVLASWQAFWAFSHEEKYKQVGSSSFQLRKESERSFCFVLLYFILYSLANCFASGAGRSTAKN